MSLQTSCNNVLNGLTQGCLGMSLYLWICTADSPSIEPTTTPKLILVTALMNKMKCSKKVLSPVEFLAHSFVSHFKQRVQKCFPFEKKHKMQ